LPNNLNVLLVGPGNIGLDYAKVLKSFDINLNVVGRSINSSKNFYEKTGIRVDSRGLENYIKDNPEPPEYAIVAVNENQLCNSTLSLIHYGVKNILVEKPGGLNHQELRRIATAGINTNIYIGYNRRFYQSVKKCREFIKDTNKPVHTTFEFTEWVHDIDFNHYTKEELKRFFLCNSSHVVDLAFHLIGTPAYLDSNTADGLDWHPSAAIFSGSGKTVKNNLFTYNANWISAGRWGIEITLEDYKLILKPLEKLYIQKKGSLDLEEVKLDKIDTDYKAGLYSQIKSFFEKDTKYLCSIEEQCNNFYLYYKIANYEDL